MSLPPDLSASFQATNELGGMGENFLRRVRRSAVSVLGDSNVGREVIELCDEHAEARRMILQDRGAGATVVAVVGATGQGKSWMIRQMVRQSSVSKSIRSGNNIDEATEKLLWVGPSPPADLDPSHEQYLHCEADKMESIGGRYLLVDSPGSTDDRRAIASVAQRALSLASVILLVVRRDQLRSQVVTVLAEASEGTIVIPVINAVRARDEMLDADIDTLISQMRHTAPTSVIVRPVIVDDFEVVSETESEVGEAAARSVADCLQQELGNSWDGDRRRSTRLSALDGRFRAALHTVLSDQLPRLTHAVQRINDEARKLPGEVAESLIGSGGPLRAAVRTRLRLSLLTDTSAVWFPYKSQLGLLNLTHGAWDRLLLSFSGSLPSLVGTVWTTTKNLVKENGAHQDVQEGLRRRSAAAVSDRLAPLAAQFRDALAIMRQQESGTATHGGDDSHSQVAFLTGVDALQESSQEIFDKEIDNVSVSKSTALICGIVGTAIFWFLMSGPVIALYSEYFAASYHTLRGLGGSLEAFPKPEFSMIFTSLVVSVLPTAIFAMIVLSLAQNSSRVEAAEQAIRERHRATIDHLQQQGVLGLRWDDPLLADAEFLLSAGAAEPEKA